MPKILILEPCQINHGDDRGAVHCDHAETPNVTGDTAKALIAAGRAVYLDRKDDPNKAGRDTATAAMLEAAALVRKARKVQTSAADEGEQK